MAAENFADIAKTSTNGAEHQFSEEELKRLYALQTGSIDQIDMFTVIYQSMTPSEKQQFNTYARKQNSSKWVPTVTIVAVLMIVVYILTKMK